MKVSVNYLKRYLDFDLPDINELASIIGARLGALEEQPVSLKDASKDALIVKVESCQPIEGSDHLNLCLINDGQKKQDAQRNDQGFVQVVCGAPNVRSGMLAVWLPPGSILPASYFKDQLKLEVRPIRGQTSNGMLASAKELAISEDHEGLLVIDNDANPGDSFVDVFELDDYLLDIENKMFTHRPDCFGLLGVAREVSGILNHPFKSPGWYLEPESINAEGSIKLNVQNEIPSKVQRFSVIAIDNVEIKPSPLELQSYLSRMGIRPINNVVDLTNIVMLETGQPLHAYDLDKLKVLAGNDLTMTIRAPRSSEKLTLLNGKEITLPEAAIGIAAGDQLVGLGGVMGGQNSEVDKNTKSIVLEAACFNMSDIRRASMELGIFSEAVTRFTKGQSPLQTVRVLTYAVNRLKELSPESRAISDIADDMHLPEATIKRDSIHPPVTVTAKFINDRLGTELSHHQIAELLENVECHVEITDDTLNVSAPFWRTDLEIREDVVEEIGRLYGYENIKPKPLNRPLLAIPRNKDLDSKAEVRRLLSSAGANELLTYSFVSKRLIESAGQSVDKAYEIVNSLSPELEFYRLSLTPSLLSKVNMNIKAGFDEFALFELGNYHVVGPVNDVEPDLPAEYQALALVYASKKGSSPAAYFKAKNFLTYLTYELNIPGISFEPLNRVENLADHLSEIAKPFDKNRSALIKTPDGEWGIVGEYTPQVTSNLKLPKYSAGLEVDSRLFLRSEKDKVYKRLSKYPSLKQDITLKISDEPTFADIDSFLTSELIKLIPKDSSYEFIPLGIFAPKGDQNTKNYTFHLTIASLDKTLKDVEVNTVLDKLASLAKDKFGAERV